MKEEENEITHFRYKFSIEHLFLTKSGKLPGLTMLFPLRYYIYFVQTELLIMLNAGGHLDEIQFKKKNVH